MDIPVPVTLHGFVRFHTCQIICALTAAEYLSTRCKLIVDYMPFLSQSGLGLFHDGLLQVDFVYLVASLGLAYAVVNFV